MSAGAHFRPCKILQYDWLPIERSQNYDPNRAGIYVGGEPARSTCNNEGWIMRSQGRNDLAHVRFNGHGIPIQGEKKVYGKVVP